MSLERLSEAIEEVELPLDGEVLAEGFRLLDRMTAKLTAAIGGFDAAQLWDLDGDTSMTAWLRHHPE